MSTAATTLAPLTTSAQIDTTKRDWHASTTVQVRRRVLLQILLLLKTKYGKVDAKISYIARRAELALYTQAFSAIEYRNPKTLNRRLHSLVVKLHMNNLAAQEDKVFGVEADDSAMDSSSCQLHGKRVRPSEEPSDPATVVVVAAPCKRPRTAVMAAAAVLKDSAPQAPSESPLFFNGNVDLLQHVCSFLDAHANLRLAATNRSARHIVPSFITCIRVSVQTLDTLCPPARTTFFDRFPNLELVEVTGDKQSHLHFDFQNELGLVRRNVICRSLLVALSRQPLAKLQCMRWHYAYVDGVHDRITSQIADVLLDRSKFPHLSELSLVGNAVSDDGVAHLCKSLRQASRPMAIKLLNLEQNFVGERGHLQLEELVHSVASRDSDRGVESDGTAATLMVKLSGNLLTSPARAS